jgi:hypothetical protein
MVGRSPILLTLLSITSILLLKITPPIMAATYPSQIGSPISMSQSVYKVGDQVVVSWSFRCPSSSPNEQGFSLSLTFSGPNPPPPVGGKCNFIDQGGYVLGTAVASDVGYWQVTATWSSYCIPSSGGPPIACQHIVTTQYQTRFQVQGATSCQYGGTWPNCNPPPSCQYGGTYPNCNPPPSCQYGGTYPNCNPPPSCQYGGTYPNCDPPPSCQYGGTYPNCNPPPSCPYGGTYPNCNPAPSCQYGGTYPNCNSAPTCQYGGTWPNCNSPPPSEQSQEPGSVNYQNGLSQNVPLSGGSLQGTLYSGNVHVDENGYELSGTFSQIGASTKFGGVDTSFSFAVGSAEITGKAGIGDTGASVGVSLLSMKANYDGVGLQLDAGGIGFSAHFGADTIEVGGDIGLGGATITLHPKEIADDLSNWWNSVIGSKLGTASSPRADENRFSGMATNGLLNSVCSFSHQFWIHTSSLQGATVVVWKSPSEDCARFSLGFKSCMDARVDSS